jgi:hypothetical protein
MLDFDISNCYILRVTIQMTVRTLRDLNKLVVNNSFIPAQKRLDGELLLLRNHFSES